MEDNTVKNVDIPFEYPRCVITTCGQAGTCLRSMAWKRLCRTDNTATVLNPLLADGVSGRCRFYRDSTPERYARGFAYMQQYMVPAQYATFMRTCIARYGRNGYFKRRRGDIPLSPADQRFILGLLRDIGLGTAPGFQGYEMRYSW